MWKHSRSSQFLIMDMLQKKHEQSPSVSCFLHHSLYIAFVQHIASIARSRASLIFCVNSESLWDVSTR